MATPLIPDIPKFSEEEHIRRYPSQKDCSEISQCCKGCDDEDLPIGVCFNDIPVKDRKKYMWMIPQRLKDHPMYKEQNYGARIKREDALKLKRDEDDKRKKEQDKDDAIQTLLKHVAKLTDQVNELTKKIK